MTDWTRVPVVVGAGQLTNRDEDPSRAPSPFDLMEAASRDAVASAVGAARVDAVLQELTHLFMVHSLSLRHGDPARYLAERLGAKAADARTSGMGGNIPQWLVNRAAELVVAGERPRVLVAGAEALATKKRAKKAGLSLDWPTAEGWPDMWPPLDMDMGVHKVERTHGLEQATTMYALMETAVTHAYGRSPDEQRAAMGRLMGRLNEVAASNPLSWFPERRDGAEIMDVTADNRIIFWPYPKYVNAVMDVDMGAAVLVTDAATAREWGLGEDEVAYLSGWGDAHDIWFLSERHELHRAESLTASVARATATAGIGVDDIGAFDLYSCFPSSIEVARDALGIGEEDARPLTLTGGLPYHGGPGSNYVTHAIANALRWIRDGEGDHALVHGNGFYLTKHAVGVYSRRPPTATPSAGDDLQAQLDASFRPLAVERTLEGAATVVAYTVPYDREGAPQSGVVMLQSEGRRTAAIADDELTAALVAGDAVGLAVHVAPEGGDSKRNLARLA